ncbi:MAG: hydroxyacylglutathione hydrolase [Chlamydiota bacterium]
MLDMRLIGKEKLILIPILKDNYAYLIAWDHSALIVDPGEGSPELAVIEKEKLELKYILATHHHKDHIGGAQLLQEKTDCALIAPDDPQISQVDRIASDGEELILGPFSIQVVATPGHTKSHVVYYFSEQKVLFSGDLLFAGGCGYLYEGTSQEMWHSLQKLFQFPDDTEIYCGHEYTERNLEFAAHIEPTNRRVAERLKKVKALRSQGKPTIPSTLGEETMTNPFLRVTEKELQQAVGMNGADPEAVFAAIREKKNHF